MVWCSQELYNRRQRKPKQFTSWFRHQASASVRLTSAGLDEVMLTISLWWKVDECSTIPLSDMGSPFFTNKCVSASIPLLCLQTDSGKFPFIKQKFYKHDFACLYSVKVVWIHFLVHYYLHHMIWLYSFTVVHVFSDIQQNRICIWFCRVSPQTACNYPHYWVHWILYN